MAEPNAVVLHPFHGPGLAEALEHDHGIRVIVPEDADGVVEELAAGARGLITYQWEDRYASGAVAWIQALSAGVEQFPEGLLRDRGIVLTSARGGHSPSVAEHAIALMMGLVRRLGTAVHGAPDRTWQPAPAFEVGGRTAGILGLGAIGEAIAERAAALGMAVIGTKRDPSGYSGTAGEVFAPSETLEVCRRADVLIIALPADPATTGLIGEQELAALGDGWLVNVGRGSVVDEDALAAALSDGDLRGAGLDVAATEPLPDDSPLWDHPDVIITPHMGWSSDRLAGRLAVIIATNARALAGEGDWLNRVL